MADLYIPYSSCLPPPETVCKYRLIMSGNTPKKKWIGASAIFSISILVRLLHLLFYKDSPYCEYPVVDAKVYLDMATRIAYGEFWRLDGIFYQAPLYPYFLGGVLFLTGFKSLIIPRIVQSILGSLSASLVYLIAYRIFPSASTSSGSVKRRIDFPALSGLAMAFNGPMIFFDCELLNPSLLVFLTALSLYLVVIAVTNKEKNPGYILWYFSGIAAGLSAITGGGILLFLPFLLFVLATGRSPSQTFRVFVVFLLGISAPLLVVTSRNYLVGKEFVLISSNSGLNFYIGNNPEYDKTVNTRPGAEWKALADEPKAYGINSHREYSRFFFKKSLSSILEDPGGYGIVVVNKLYLLANGGEIPRNQEIYPVREYSPVLSALLWKGELFFGFPFGLILPFALYTLAAHKKNSGVKVLKLFALSQALFVLLFFITSRYRLQMALPLIILFPLGLSDAWRDIRAKRFLRILPLAALFVICNLQPAGSSPENTADTRYNFALAMEKNGKVDDAIKWYRQSLETDPGKLEARMNLGTLLVKARGDFDGALAEYEQALKKYPDHPPLLANIARCYALKGDNINAERYMERARNSVESYSNWE